MGEKFFATYLGPGEWWGFNHPEFGVHEFNVGEKKEVSVEVAEYLSKLNPWGATIDNAADYGARLFEITGGDSVTFGDGGGD